MCAGENLELWERIQSDGHDERIEKLTTWLYPSCEERMYRYPEANQGVMALKKGEMTRTCLAQHL